MATVIDQNTAGDDGVGIHSHTQIQDQDQAQTRAVDVGVNLNIDVNALIRDIANTVNSLVNGNADREAFVKTLLETVISSTRGQHNVMIFNMRQGFDFNPDRSRSWFTSQSYQGILFGIWVFAGPVRFVNQGDGGWINWGFYGSFNRNGGTVDFN